MFNYVKLQNYRSLIDFQVDLTAKRGVPKTFLLIYGENGVGKSNFASAFFTLYQTLRTVSTKNMLEKIRESAAGEALDYNLLQTFMKENRKDITSIIKGSKTIHSQGNMVLEFGFSLEGKNGTYRLETNDFRIVAERLDFVLHKNKTNFFDIDENSVKLNDRIFKNLEYKEEVSHLVEKYWGKHSLLALLIYESEEKNGGYVENRVIDSLFELISHFMTISICVKDECHVGGSELNVSRKLWSSLEKGSIPSEETNALDKTEAFLNQFFTRLYSDIKQVYYKREPAADTVLYQLMFKKLIHNQLLDIAFENESTGTLHLLKILPFFMAGAAGETAILDEMDTGIHDLLITALLENLYASVRGQIIMTTHNTILLESRLPKDCIYIFNADENANKELLPLGAFEEHLHPNLNIRKRYLRGLYGGVPITAEVDFSKLQEMTE